MVSISTFRKIALSFPGASEDLHFDKTSFRVNKKIFATYDSKLKRACIRLSEIDQHVFSTADRQNIFPVDNKWGKQGWTLVEMTRVRKDLFKDALTTAYCQVAPRKFAEQVQSPGNDKDRTNNKI
jgi:predicted DNA-binding protein (MmcQ/YjbR family)